jgi:short-chain Z-isoprenyl diphosphate synthase
MPRHIGIILDGNRRHARKLGITDPRTVYGIGAQKLDDVLDWCAEIDIPTVTLWVFSPENLRRPGEEVSGILAAVEAKLTALAQDARIHDRRVRVRAIGKQSLVPTLVRTAIQAAEAATAKYEGMVLNIAIGYGGRHRCCHCAVARRVVACRNDCGALSGSDWPLSLIPRGLRFYGRGNVALRCQNVHCSAA